MFLPVPPILAGSLQYNTLQHGLLRQYWIFFCRAVACMPPQWAFFALTHITLLPHGPGASETVAGGKAKSASFIGTYYWRFFTTQPLVRGEWPKLEHLWGRVLLRFSGGSTFQARDSRLMVRGRLRWSRRRFRLQGCARLAKCSIHLRRQRAQL